MGVVGGERERGGGGGGGEVWPHTSQPPSTQNSGDLLWENARRRPELTQLPMATGTG